MTKENAKGQSRVMAKILMQCLTLGTAKTIENIMAFQGCDETTAKAMILYAGKQIGLEL